MNFQLKENVLMYNVNIFAFIPTQLQNIASNILVGGAYESHRVVLHTQTGLQLEAITPKLEPEPTLRPVSSKVSGRGRWYLQERFGFRGPLQETQINMPLQEFQTPPGHEIWGREASAYGDSFPTPIWKRKKKKMEAARGTVKRSWKLSKHYPSSGFFVSLKEKKKHSRPTLQPSCLQW